MTPAIGDIVHLKSGSPALTVDEITQEPAVKVSWFAGEEWRTAVFHPDMLMGFSAIGSFDMHSPAKTLRRISLHDAAGFKASPQFLQSPPSAFSRFRTQVRTLLQRLAAWASAVGQPHASPKIAPEAPASRLDVGDKQ